MTSINSNSTVLFQAKRNSTFRTDFTQGPNGEEKKILDDINKTIKTINKFINQSYISSSQREVLRSASLALGQAIFYLQKEGLKNFDRLEFVQSLQNTIKALRSAIPYILQTISAWITERKAQFRDARLPLEENSDLNKWKADYQELNSIPDNVAKILHFAQSKLQYIKSQP